MTQEAKSRSRVWAASPLARVAAVLGLSVSLLTVIGLALDVPAKLLALWRTLHEREVEVLVIRNRLELQGLLRPLRLQYPTEQAQDIGWVGLFEITNVSPQPVTILDFTVEFPAARRREGLWQLKRGGIEFRGMTTEVFGSERAFRRAYADDDGSWPPPQSGETDSRGEVELPYRLDAGKRMWFAFHSEYNAYLNGGRVSFSNTKILEEVLPYLWGARIEPNGSYRCRFGDMPVVVKLAPNIEYRRQVHMLMGSPGCYVILAGHGRVPMK